MSQRKISDEELIAEYNKGKTYKQIAEEYGMAKRNVERLGARLAKRGLISTRRAPGFGYTEQSPRPDTQPDIIPLTPRHPSPRLITTVFRKKI